jgi:hypothetical protein
MKMRSVLIIDQNVINCLVYEIKIFSWQETELQALNIYKEVLKIERI